MPNKNENKTINMYGTNIAAAATPYVYLYKGKYVFDKTASASASIAVWDDAPALGGAGLGGDLPIGTPDLAPAAPTDAASIPSGGLGVPTF